MTDRINITLFEPEQAHKVLTKQIWPTIKAALIDGRRMVIDVRPETRTLAQNAMLWATLADISRQVDWYGRKLTPEEWKHVFTASLSRQDVVPGLEGGFVVLGKATSKMTKGEMSELHELMLAFRSQQGVKFTAPEFIKQDAGEIV